MVPNGIDLALFPPPPSTEPKPREEVVLGSVGHDLCEKFFRGYTCKQWGLDLSELAAGVDHASATSTSRP